MENVQFVYCSIWQHQQSLASPCIHMYLFLMLEHAKWYEVKVFFFGKFFKVIDDVSTLVLWGLSIRDILRTWSPCIMPEWVVETGSLTTLKKYANEHLNENHIELYCAETGPLAKLIHVP